MDQNSQVTQKSKMNHTQEKVMNKKDIKYLKNGQEVVVKREFSDGFSVCNILYHDGYYDDGGGGHNNDDGGGMNQPQGVQCAQQ